MNRWVVSYVITVVMLTSIGLGEFTLFSNPNLIVPAGLVLLTGFHLITSRKEAFKELLKNLKKIFRLEGPGGGLRN